MREGRPGSTRRACLGRWDPRCAPPWLPGWTASLSVVPRSVKRLGRAVGADGRANRVGVGRAGPEQLLEDRPTTVELDLEVARPASDATRELRGDPPAELLEGV